MGEEEEGRIPRAHIPAGVWEDPSLGPLNANEFSAPSSAASPRTCNTDTGRKLSDSCGRSRPSHHLTASHNPLSHHTSSSFYSHLLPALLFSLSLPLSSPPPHSCALLLSPPLCVCSLFLLHPAPRLCSVAWFLTNSHHLHTQRTYYFLLLFHFGAPLTTLSPSLSPFLPLSRPCRSPPSVSDNGLPLRLSLSTKKEIISQKPESRSPTATPSHRFRPLLPSIALSLRQHLVAAVVLIHGTVPAEETTNLEQ